MKYIRRIKVAPEGPKTAEWVVVKLPNHQYGVLDRDANRIGQYPYRRDRYQVVSSHRTLAAAKDKVNRLELIWKE